MNILLSVTLLGIVMVRPLGASVMDGFCPAMIEEGYRAPINASSLESGMSTPCAVASGCIAANVVHPSSVSLGVSLAVVLVPYSWATRTISGLDVPPELGPPRRVA